MSNSLADYVNIGVPTNDQIISPNTISDPSKPAVLFKVDVLIGTAGNDVLRAPAGSFGSIMIGGAGADTLIGGVFSRDAASYSTATSGVTASFLNPSLNTGDAKGDTYTNMDDLIGSNFDDILTGDSNANNLEGGLGNDLFMATAGGDLYIGGDGIDTVDYSLFSSGVNSNLGGPGGYSSRTSTLGSRT